MILREFTQQNAAKLRKLTRTLSENYNYALNFNTLTAPKALAMIGNVNEKRDASKDVNNRVKLGLIAESLALWHKAAVQTELTETLDDTAMEGAKVILAAKEISDKIQGMIEDAAKMQVQDLLPIVDAMKSEIGTNEAETFSQTADAALGQLVESLKSTKTEFDNAIAGAQGESVGMDMDMGMDDMGMDMDTDMGDEFAEPGDEAGFGMDDEFAEPDDFEGDDTNLGGEEPSGREMKAEF